METVTDWGQAREIRWSDGRVGEPRFVDYGVIYAYMKR